MDVQLENAISEAGRERVFAIMRAAGWGPHDNPPKWVWWRAVGMARPLSAVELSSIGSLAPRLPSQQHKARQ
jgi:hypothetical protein